MAIQTKINAPITVIVENADSIDKITKRIGNKFILKPRWNSGSSGIQIIDSDIKRENLIKDWYRNPPQGQYIAQEFVPGHGVGVGVLLKDGVVVAAIGHERIRELPITGGTSCARRTLNNTELLGQAIKLLRSSKLKNGLCMVEFRYDSSTGNSWVIECNPRYWGGISTEIQSGVDFPKLHVQSHLGHGYDSDYQITNIESRWLMGELKYAMDSILIGNLNNIKNIFNITPNHKLYIEDIGKNKIKSFFAQLKGVYISYRKHKNFGFQSRHKAAFFDKLMKEKLINAKGK